jgi:putative Ca2+/H+ antiporter (TMEM165/GDT1 family)
VQAFFVATCLVAIAEIGDKTMLLAVVLAARWRQRWSILAGILVATLLNHALASLLGATAAQWLEGPAMRWVLGISFLAFAAWTLVPDRLDADDAPPPTPRGGVFVATMVAFFLVEIGDKTQVATAALAARFQDVLVVTAGTTLGMMLANAPAVLLGEALARRVPMRVVRCVAAALFAATGAAVLLQA